MAMVHQRKSPSARRGVLVGVVLTGLLLTGCKTFSPNGGMDLVAGVAGGELRKDVVAIRTVDEADAARARIDALLRKPLTADAAVQIALLNNRGLQAAYNALGIAEAEMIQASLPPAPTIKIERLTNPFEIEIERRIVANILSLLTLPARASVAADRFHQAQLRAAEETLRVAAEARRNYYRAVASRELAGFLDQAKSAAETATQLAKRLGETGAMNKLDQAREQVFYADITAQLATTRQRAASEREKLIRSLGLWGADLGFRLPGALPALPGKQRALPDIEVEAVTRRVDLQIARIELAALAKTYDLTQASRFVNLLELSGIGKTQKERDTGEKLRTRGFEAEFQIPIFDLGEARVRMAAETYMQAFNRLTDKAVSVRSEARDAYRTYRSTYDIARHYRNEVLPLRKIISDETLLRYNAMQIDVFSLLAEARQRIAATNQAIEAQREFWLASIDLGVAVVGGGVAGSGEGTSTVAAAAGGEAGGH
jgi:outer membrane protein TolC